MEQWKGIPGYEGLYEASTEGRIRTVAGKITSNTWSERRVWKQRIMKFKYMNRKSTGKCDARVTLWKDGKERTFLVSRLVAMTWCPGYTDGMTVNHINGDTLDNRIENLEWLTLADNVRHAFATGLIQTEKPCTLMDEDGTITRYRSQSEASRNIGRNCHYITCCVSKKAPIRSADGRVFQIVTA